MNARKEIGQKIARARRRRGLSQSVLAGLIGRSESWLSQVERGQRSVDSHSVINALSQIPTLPVEELTVKKVDDSLMMAPYAHTSVIILRTSWASVRSVAATNF